MTQEELDEISEAFEDAWENYFGCLMTYVPFNRNSKKDSLYNESTSKKYLEDKAINFHGTLKESVVEDKLMGAGKMKAKYFEITCVTKELIDKGLQSIDTDALIILVDRFGKKRKLSIYDDYQKVQLVDNKLFTKLRVVEHG